MTDARKALGRLSSRGIVKLRGVDYYQAGVGLKADFRFEDAIDTFQLALASLSPKDIKEMNEVAPLCLNEIGEVNYRLERYVESTVPRPRRRRREHRLERVLGTARAVLLRASG